MIRVSAPSHRTAARSPRTRRLLRTGVAIAGAALLVSIPALAAASTPANGSTARTPGPQPTKISSITAQSVTDLTGGLTAEDLAQALIGEGVEVSNVTYVGDNHAAGTFTGFADPFGIDGGVALSSGAIANSTDYTSNLIGPNQSDSITASFGTQGDSDLDQLVNPLKTYDAAVLEFDFVADGPNISFKYIFGSDEYLEYVGSDFNDVFAFYVDGTNCATVPNPDGAGQVPVTINTINKDDNPNLFRSNSLADDPPAPFNTELDGFTVSLTCAASVSVGESHHLKLAIADTSDTSLDSTVLIQAGSLQTNDPPVADDQSVQTVVDTPVGITLTGSDPNGDAITFAVATQPEHGTLSGDAPNVTYTPNEGYIGPDSFTFTTNDGALTSDPGTVSITVLASSPTVTPTETPTETPTTTPTSTSTTTLPGTGTNSSTPWLGLWGIVLLLGGGLAVVVARRRLGTAS